MIVQLEYTGGPKDGRVEWVQISPFKKLSRRPAVKIDEVWKYKFSGVTSPQPYALAEKVKA